MTQQYDRCAMRFCLLRLGETTVRSLIHTNAKVSFKRFIALKKF